MLAASILFYRYPEFFNLAKMKLQPHLCYCARHNTENDDVETKSLVISMLAVSSKDGYDLSSIKEIILHNAKNKNITRTVKTNETERFRSDFDFANKLGKALKNYQYGTKPSTSANAGSTPVPPNQNMVQIQQLLAGIGAGTPSFGDDDTYFELSGDAEQDALQHLVNISLDYDFTGLPNVIRAYLQFDDKDFIIFDASNFDAIKEAAEQFRSLGFHETCSLLGDTRGIMSINDKMMFNLKMSLDSTVYDSLSRIKI